MKHRLILNILLVGTLFSCSQKQTVPANEYLIEGKLSGVSDSILIQLFERYGSIQKCAFVDTLIGGTFMFRDTLSAPRIVYIRSRDKSFPATTLPVWVAPGKHIRIKGHDKLLKTWQIESDIPEQTEENGYRDNVAEETAGLMKLMARANELMYLIRYERNKSPETGKQAKRERDSLLNLTDNLQDIITQKTIDYMKTSPITPIWMDKLLSYSKFLNHGLYSGQKENINELFNRLSEEQKQTPAAKLIASYLHPMPTVGLGDDMADGDLYDLQGNIRHLSEFKGKYILLDFWSSACGPCIASIPEMKEAEKQYKDRVEVIGISDDEEKTWKDFIQENDLKGNQWREKQAGGNSLALRYQVKGIPNYVLIAPDGKIQARWSGYGKGSIFAELKKHLQ